jgi:hypothetical protein
MGPWLALGTRRLIFFLSFLHIYALLGVASNCRHKCYGSEAFRALPLQSMETWACFPVECESKSLHHTSRSSTMTLYVLQTLPLLQKLIHVQNVGKNPKRYCGCAGFPLLMFDLVTPDQCIRALGEAHAAPPTNSPWLRDLLGTASPFFPALTKLIHHATSSCTSITVALEALV